MALLRILSRMLTKADLVNDNTRRNPYEKTEIPDCRPAADGLPCRQCNRDTGNPVYHPLSALVGLYVTVVEVN